MIYLDNAATSFPKPESVIARVTEVMTKFGGNPGRGSHAFALEASRVIFSTRELLAKFLNVKDSSRLVFTKSATEAVNLALKGELKNGDRVLTGPFEHNSVVKTLKALERDGVIVEKIKSNIPGLVTKADVEKSLKPGVKMLVLMHASNVFGTIQPIEEIAALCRERGVLFMTDAAQTVGALPIDLEKIKPDYFIGTGHKSLLGPQGTGFLYIRDGLQPKILVDGGTGNAESLLAIPERYEAGTMNTPGIGGLGAGIEFVMKEGIEKIRAYEEALIEELIKGLRKIPGAGIIGPEAASLRASLVSFTLDNITADGAGMKLDREFSIMARCGTHCSPWAHETAGTLPYGTIRVSPGYFNTHADIEGFLSAITRIAKGA